MNQQLLRETPYEIPLPNPFALDRLPAFSDYHTHTEASPDSEESIYAVCAAAVRNGLAEIAVTDHCDCEKDECISRSAASYSSVVKAAPEYSPELIVRKGIELGEANHAPDRAAYVLSLREYDFVLGAIHNIKGKKDFYYMSDEPDPEGLIAEYFDEIIELCKVGDFDVLAHITYPLRYGNFMKRVDISHFEKQISTIFRLLIDSGRGLEINTSGLRKPDFAQLSPTCELLKLYKSLGGEIITFGSDAHRAADVAFGMLPAYNAAKAAGFTRYTVYNKRCPLFVNFHQ